MRHELALIPGLNNTAQVFEDVVAALPGHVRTHAWDNPELDTVEALAAHWLERLPEHFWLGGFSFGGYVSLAMLDMAPQRICGLALICTSPFSDTEAVALRRLTALEKAAQGGYTAMVQAQEAQAFHPDSLSNAHLLSRRREMVRQYGSERYIHHVRATMARHDRSGLLDGSKPTLVVSADGDLVIPAETVKTYARRIPRSRLEVIPGAGHLLPMERPAELARLLAQWMDGLQAPAG